MAGSDLLSAIMGAQYKASEDPFGIAASTISQASPLLVNPYGSTGSNIGYTLGAGLLSGLLGGIARNQTDSENAALFPKEMQFISGTPDVQASLLQDEPRLSSLSNLALQNQLSNQNLVKETAIKEALTDPAKAAIAKQLYGIDVPSLAGLSPSDAGTATGKASPENVSSDQSGSSKSYLDALMAAGGDPVLARQMLKEKADQENKDRLQQTQIGTLSKSLSVIQQLDALKKKASAASFLPEAITPDYVQGIAQSLGAKVDPGSDAATYNSAVIPLSDSLLRALTEVGRGSQYNLQKIIDDLSTAWGKGPDAISKRVRNYQEDLLIGLQQKAKDMVAGGYKGAQPFLDQVSNLNLDDLSSLGAGASPAQVSREDAIAELKRRGVL